MSTCDFHNSGKTQRLERSLWENGFLLPPLANLVNEKNFCIVYLESEKSKKKYSPNVRIGDSLTHIPMWNLATGVIRDYRMYIKTCKDNIYIYIYIRMYTLRGHPDGQKKHFEHGPLFRTARMGPLDSVCWVFLFTVPFHPPISPCLHQPKIVSLAKVLWFPPPLWPKAVGHWWSRCPKNRRIPTYAWQLMDMPTWLRTSIQHLLASSLGMCTWPRDFLLHETLGGIVEIYTCSIQNHSVE